MLVTGTASGHLYLWQNFECINSVKAHDGPVTSLHSCSEVGKKFYPKRKK